MRKASLDEARVFVTRLWPGDALDALRQTGATVDVWQGHDAPPHDVLVAEAGRSDALVTTVEDPVDAAVFEAGRGRLALVAQAGVGVDNIDLDAARVHGVEVTNAPDVLTEATADLAFALALSAARRLREADRSVRQGAWTGWDPAGFLGLELHGATVGVVGLGRIGQAFARRCEGFAMRVLYTTRTPRPDADARGYAHAPLGTLLAEADIVSLHTPLTPETHHLIGHAELRAMKRGAVLVNTARGSVIDTDALVEVLRDGHLLGVGLDVTDPEPLPADHPLLGFERVVVVPHVGSASHATRAAIIGLAVDNVRAVLTGQPPKTPAG